MMDQNIGRAIPRGIDEQDRRPGQVGVREGQQAEKEDRSGTSPKEAGSLSDGPLLQIVLFLFHGVPFF